MAVHDRCSMLVLGGSISAELAPKEFAVFKPSSTRATLRLPEGRPAAL